MMTAEKMKREKWLKEKTQEVREHAVKGLEKELEKIIAKNKLDMRKMEERLKREKTLARDEVALEFEEKFS